MMGSQVSIFEYAATQENMIMVQTRMGEQRVEAISIVGQCALHEAMENDGSYTVSHILSGLSVIHFNPLGYEAALLLLDNLNGIDLDSYYRGRRTKRVEKQVKRAVRQSIRAYWDSVESPEE
jgi:hypothetical protein